MIDFPIVDTHLHVWDPGLLPYSWLKDIPLLNRPFLLEDYDKACGDVVVEKMVFLQCEVDTTHYEQEAAWVSELATKDPRIQGMVPWAPCEKGQPVRADLERLVQNNPLTKGVRRIIQFEEDIAFCLDPQFIDGVRAVSGLNLHFELCLYHPQLENVVKMVRQCPDVRFMLDHIGKPDIKNAVMEPWKTHLSALAEMQNVWCKVSGMATEADMDSWTKEDLRPYIDHVIDAFGIDRVAYGGDWPVATQATEYPRWVQTLDWATGDLSAGEKKKLFHDNAIKFYRL